MKKSFLYLAIIILTLTQFISNAFASWDGDKFLETDNSIRKIVFSGITWQVRNRQGNPGGNNWSDSEKSVWVDENGMLHLTIRNIDGKWYCSEIYSDEKVGFGEYKFYLACNVDKFDKNVVLGLFTYLNDENEIDIEFSKWGNEKEKNMGNYVIQPARINGNSHSFNLNLRGIYSTHRFVWEPKKIQFESWNGNDSTPSDTLFIYQWDYTGKNIPVPSNEKLIINLWMYKGKVPSDKNEVEIVIKAVEVNKIIEE